MAINSFVRKVDVNIDNLSNELMSSVKNNKLFVINEGVKKYNELGWKRFLENNCNLIIDRRHFPDKLNYSDWWEVSYQPGKATSYAYSNTKQPLHTDNAWYSEPPEIIFFIMKKQSNVGGEFNLYPLSRIIDDLQIEEPGLLEDLTNIKVRFAKGEGENYVDTTIITLYPEPRITWNYYRFERSDKDIVRMCETFFDFIKSKEDTLSVEHFRANTGDCFCMHDQKFLHGRNAFKAEKKLDRILLVSLWKYNIN